MAPSLSQSKSPRQPGPSGPAESPRSGDLRRKPAFDAAIFDMDGVITKTAAVHSQAWKRMFDEYLGSRAARFGEPFREFTHGGDYLSFVDGRPRYEGVVAFLEARGIALAFGEPEDAPGRETVCGLGNRKNELFNEIVENEGVGLYESTVALIREMRARGVRIGLATSSKNAELVLRKSGTASLFSTVVDGVVSARLGLRGKPAPDIFAAACADLRAERSSAVVVEDALSGVRAASEGGFGLVIGVARENNVRELRENGADLVVGDLAEADVDGIGRLLLAKRAGS